MDEDSKDSPHEDKEDKDEVDSNKMSTISEDQIEAEPDIEVKVYFLWLHKLYSRG